MKNMTLKNIAGAVKGVLHLEGLPQDADIDVDTSEAAGVVLDSRKVEKGYIFIATCGERVDGHSFIDSVFEAGAMGVICEKTPGNPKGAFILVEDSFQALKDLAEFYRRQLDIKVVGVTGSVGKTSTKEFVASVLAKKYKVLKTQGNFNNEVGLPLTVLQIPGDCQVAVLEMGISDFGEMHRLSRIARPDVCLITNIGQCHLENLGTRDGILKAKTEIFDFMHSNARICLNGDDDKLITIKEVKGQVPIFFGGGSNNDIYATHYENKGLVGSSALIHIRRKDGKNEEFEADIPLPGEHMLYNALAAAAVGAVFELTTGQIQEGIKDVEAVDGRSHVINTGKLTLIDDCYNANPMSMKAAIDLLSITVSMADTHEMPDLAHTERLRKPRKVAILGDMFELGTDEAALHHEVGVYAAEKEVDVVICAGMLCKNMYEGAKSVDNSQVQLYYYADKEKLIEDIETIVNNGDIVLVKASHGMHFEEIIAKLS